MPEPIRLTVDGEEISVAPGTTVASAVWNLGKRSFRRAVGGSFRAPLCGMGVCFECRLTVDGLPGERTCTLPCREGMVVETADPGSLRGRDGGSDRV